jgi:hypothetical protein
MPFIVALIGSLFFAIGFLVLLNPTKFKWFLTTLTSRRVLAASVFRILIGIIFLFSAPETRAPLFIRVLGLLFILGGLLVPVLGLSRSEAFAAWWVKRSNAALRLWASFAMLLGGAIFWAAMKTY